MAGLVSSLKTGYEVIGDYGVGYLDDYLGGIKKNDFVLIGATSGLGKTAFAYQIAFRNSIKRRVHLFALEADYNEPYYRELYRIFAKKYYANPNFKRETVNYRKFITGGIESPLLLEAEEELKTKHQKLTVHYRDQEGFDLSALILKLNQPNISRAELLVIDHIDYFDVNDPHSENYEIGEIMKVLRSFNYTHGIPIVLISHLRKKDNRKQLIPDMDDFHGTSNKIKQVKTAITISPDYKNSDYAQGRYSTFFNISKDRLFGCPRLVGRTVFDRRFNAYEKSYELAVSKNYGEEMEVLDYGQYPDWANTKDSSEQGLL